MGQYYAKSLSAERLKRCYDIAPSRTQQYLEAEIQHALSYLSSKDVVLELGCGYGRFLERLLIPCESVVGIDISFENLMMAKKLQHTYHHLQLLQMNANTLAFPDGFFDVVLCIQNGISAFKLDPLHLVRESIRVTKPGGTSIFSSYSDKFWKPRLDWFRLQSDEGLLGEIDWNSTKDGVIVCKDGFRATTFGIDDFTAIVDRLDKQCSLVEIDNSSIFCIIKV
jgi:2-polyprenyl-6-hydroxyphenyl methylase/3-demethylubiquinone-9 3-methyltransferase